MNKKYNRTKFIKSGITFYIYHDLNDLLRSYFRGLLSVECEGINGRNKKKYKFTIDKLFELLTEEGYWGYCKGKKSIHLWVNKKKKSFKEVLIDLIAHEIGHTIKPFYKQMKKEETKATEYEDFVGLAYDVTEKIMGVIK